MEEGYKTALAFLGIFAFLGLAIFSQADITTHLGLETEQQEPDTLDQTQETNRQASTQFTESFEGELGPEYVFDIETESLEFSRSEANREYYEASLRFELTKFGEQVLQTSNEEEVKELVEESFENYPEGDYARDLIADVNAASEGRISDLEREVLTGNLEEFSENNGQANIVISVQEGENAEIKWGSFSTVWTMSTEEPSGEAAINVDESGMVQTVSGVVQTSPLEDGPQTQFYTNFSEYGSDSELFDDFTPEDTQGYENTGDWSVIQDSTLEGNTAVEGDAGSFNSVLKWEDLGVVDTVEVYAKVRTTVSVADYANEFGHVAIRANNIENDGWYGSVFTRYDGDEWNDHILTLTQGTTVTQLSSEPVDSTNGSEEVWHIRMQSEGDFHKVRRWRDGDSEPEDWDFTATDDTISSGYAGLWTTADMDGRGSTFEILGVGLEGDSAPKNPVN